MSLNNHSKPSRMRSGGISISLRTFDCSPFSRQVVFLPASLVGSYRGRGTKGALPSTTRRWFFQPPGFAHSALLRASLFHGFPRHTHHETHDILRLRV